tara:strand:+ start:1685 stop:2032 length:348 start_codon:yes stop_codon:yes gene_type:complete
MARWENEDVSDLNLPDPEKIETTFIGLHGEETTEDKAMAKRVESSNGSVRFYVKYGRNELLDPHNADSSFAVARRRTHLYKFKKVSKDTFDNYTTYLKNKNRLYFTKARRLVMEN